MYHPQSGARSWTLHHGKREMLGVISLVTVYG
jgi:hypothetical protein